jgi:hypothetical protein
VTREGLGPTPKMACPERLSRGSRGSPIFVPTLAHESRNDPPHPRRGRRAGHHRVSRLPLSQRGVSGIHRRERTGRPQVGPRGTTRYRGPRCHAARRLGLRCSVRAEAAGRDQGRGSHSPDRASRGDRSDPRALTRRRRLPHEAILSSGAVATGWRAAPPPGFACRQCGIDPLSRPDIY